MSLFRRSPRTEQRSIGAGLPFNMGGPGHNAAGSTSMSGALRLVPVYSACTLIVNAVRTAPVHAFRDAERGGKSRISAQPAVVVAPGGPGITRAAWISQCIMSRLLRGNAYGLTTQLDGMARPAAVTWLNPDVVTVDERGALPEYFINGKHVDRALITHIADYTLPGSVVGLSPLTLFRTQLDTGVRIDESTHSYYLQASNPRGILAKTDGKVTPEQVEEAKARYNAMMTDHDILVMGNDWSWKPLAVSPADSAFVEAAKMTANQVAAIFHVPPEDIGGTTGSSLTYSTVEMNVIKRNQDAVLPWVRPLEDAWSSWLAAPQYVKFNLDASARADLATRMNAYQVALVNGIQTLDEVRALEDEAPLTPAEIDFWQANFGHRSTVPPTTPAVAADTSKGATA